MKSLSNPQTGALAKAIALIGLAIAIASFGYGWHRVVSAQDPSQDQAAQVYKLLLTARSSSSEALAPFLMSPSTGAGNSTRWIHLCP